MITDHGLDRRKPHYWCRPTDCKVAWLWSANTHRFDSSDEAMVWAIATVGPNPPGGFDRQPTRKETP